MVVLILEEIKWDQLLRGGGYDKTTGEYYYAINTIDGAVPELVPLLQNRLNNMPKEVCDSYSQLSKGLARMLRF